MSPMSEIFPAGRYMCPNCRAVTSIHVPMTQAPTHRCSALTENGDAIKSRKAFVMERKGSVRASRNSIGRLDSPEETE